MKLAMAMKVAGSRSAASNVALEATEQNKDSVYKLNFGFQGWYQEPSLEPAIPRALSVENRSAIIAVVIYNPRSCQWEFVMSFDYHSKSDLDIIPFKNSKAGKDLANAMDKKLIL